MKKKMPSGHLLKLKNRQNTVNLRTPDRCGAHNALYIVSCPVRNEYTVMLNLLNTNITYYETVDSIALYNTCILYGTRTQLLN